MNEIDLEAIAFMIVLEDAASMAPMARQEDVIADETEPRVRERPDPPYQSPAHPEGALSRAYHIDQRLPEPWAAGSKSQFVEQSATPRPSQASRTEEEVDQRGDSASVDDSIIVQQTPGVLDGDRQKLAADEKQNAATLRSAELAIVGSGFRRSLQHSPLAPSDTSGPKTHPFLEVEGRHLGPPKPDEPANVTAYIDRQRGVSEMQTETFEDDHTASGIRPATQPIPDNDHEMAGDIGPSWEQAYDARNVSPELLASPEAGQVASRKTNRAFEGQRRAIGDHERRLMQLEQRFEQSGDWPGSSSAKEVDARLVFPV